MLKKKRKEKSSSVIQFTPFVHLWALQFTLHSLVFKSKMSNEARRAHFVERAPTKMYIQSRYLSANLKKHVKEQKQNILILPIWWLVWMHLVETFL